MARERERIPVVGGWFTDDRDNPDGPGDAAGFRLLGTRCRACGTVFFPPENTHCRNPACGAGEPEPVPLSRRGRVWSCTDVRYRPPAPYASDPGRPWEPYTLVAVELAAERMVVLGQAAPGVGVADLPVGSEVEVVPGVLDEDEERVWTTWHWHPVTDEGADEAADAGTGEGTGEGGAR